MYYIHVATITDPPRNTTICKGNDVTLDCGYDWFVTPVTWIINGTSFNESTTMNSSLYQHNLRDFPSRYSFRVFSLNYTTTFQCEITSNPPVTSARVTVTVTTGKLFC